MTSLKDLLRDARVPYRMPGEHHHATPGRVQVDCPRCSPGTGKFRCGVALSGRSANCWVCGKIPAWEALKGVSVQGLKELSRSSPGEVYKRQTGGKLICPWGVGKLLPQHRMYLQDRRLDPDYVSGVWGAGGIGHHDRLGWRVYLPIVDGNEQISWTTRSIAEVKDKYHNAKPHEELRPARSTLYGLHLCGHSVIVHEGPMDAIRVGPGAVATMGASTSAAQMALLVGKPVRVICFDSEPQAQVRAVQVCNDLAGLPGKTLRVELDAKDAGSASDHEVRLLRRLLED